MKRTLGLTKQRWWHVNAVLVVGVSLLWVQTAFAPPRPKKPAGKPGPHKAPHGAPAKGRPAGPKAHPPGRTEAKPPRVLAKRRPLKAPHRRYVRGPRYWHPYAARRPVPATVYSTIGYPYYVGGTNYVFMPSGDSSQSVSPPSETPILPPAPETSEIPPSSTGEADDAYTQILELTELIHEWRTMNESPVVHERLSSAQTAGEANDVISSIRDHNRQFDRVTREAMRELSRGRSAEAEMALAGEHLDKLIELVDALPEIKETH